MESLREKEIELKKIAARLINYYGSNLEFSKTKADLSNLRKSISKYYENSIEVWPIIFENMPEEFLSHNGKFTREEKVLLTVLQLYSLHQQGSSQSVNYKRSEDEKYTRNLGESLKFLRTKDHEISSDRRFNAMMTSSTFDELAYNLRQLISLLKARTSEKVDYVRLTGDLYRYINGQRESIRLEWAQSYYKLEYKEEGEDNNEQ